MIISTTLDLTKGADKEQVQQFLDMAPDGTQIRASVYVEKADRPYQSDRTTVQLCASWPSEQGGSGVRPPAD